MSTIRIISAAILVASLAVTTFAQAQTATASAPMASASMPHDCAKPMTRHSHAADKGLPISASMSGPCAPVTAASAPKAKARHDHAKSKNL